MKVRALQKILQKAFTGMSDDDAAELIAASSQIDLPAGAVLTHEGAYETTFYILLEGDVAVSKKFNENEERLLKHLAPGDFFGEMAIIHNAPRAATITAVTPVTILEIHRDAFTAMLERSSSMSLAMVREVSRRLRENDTMAIEDLRLKARELAEAYQQLAEQEFARSEFLTVVAHELRTPLMAANGYMQMIRTGKMQGELLQTALDTVNRNMQEIMALVNDLLFLQEMDLILPDFQPFDLGSVVAQAVEQQREHGDQNKVRMILSIAPGLPDVYGDPKSIHRAVGAVLDNAIKFSPNGGDVQINVEFDDMEERVRIQDHGIGIQPHNLERIFERFYHTDRVGDHVFRGVGLGLSIARQVIEQHGGKIEVESEPDSGSVFTIRLSRNTTRASTKS